MIMNAAVLKSPALKKFDNPDITARREERAWVDLKKLNTLWFNTGTLCNLTCQNCYIESSPKNDRLVYITADEVREYFDEIKRDNLETGEIGLTGGEPFMNPYVMEIIEESLKRGFRVLVLTNAMRPMMKCKDGLLELNKKYGEMLAIRVSVDHYEKELHEEERGEESWEPMLKGLKWLSDNSFNTDIAGRTRWDDDEKELRDGFAGFFAEQDINVNAHNRKQLILFPEMDERKEVPEITTKCWDILNVSPDDMMCATSRMIVKRKGVEKPAVVACTLLPYDKEFEMGNSLREASGSVKLNHPHCAKFCVLGGGSCTSS